MTPAGSASRGSRPPSPRDAVAVRVGVLSDTHGHLYPEVVAQLEGVDHIVHAGDIGTAEVLRALRRIAPVTAVRGNVDVGAWADALPSRAEVEIGGVAVVVQHVGTRADGARREGQPMVVVAGHSHIAALENCGDVDFLNPGSAGLRRWGRPRTIALLEIRPRSHAGGRPEVTARIVDIEND